MIKISTPQLINNKLAYFCGVLTGDGSIYHRQEKSDYIIKCVGNPSDEVSFYDTILAPLIKELFSIDIVTKLHDSNKTYGFTIHSKDLFRYLVEDLDLPAGKKYDRLKIPSEIKNNNELKINFIRGLFDTDGCICFKKRYKKVPYYPVISLSSKSNKLISEVHQELAELGFKCNIFLDYTYKDIRIKQGFNTISRLEMNGRHNLKRWLRMVEFDSPKHLAKIKKYGKNSGERI